MGEPQSRRGHDGQLVLTTPATEHQQHRHKHHERQNHVHIRDNFQEKQHENAVDWNDAFSSLAKKSQDPNHHKDTENYRRHGETGQQYFPGQCPAKNHELCRKRGFDIAFCHQPKYDLILRESGILSYRPFSARSTSSGNL